MTPDPSKAFDMLAAFASVGVQTFDVTLIDLAGEKKGYYPNRSLEALRQIMPSFLQETTRRQESVIIRARKTARAELVQLDDLDQAAAERVAPFAFLVFTTSPGNFQAWIAVEDSSAADFALRLKRGSGADAFASGATRIAGSVNFKKKYAPAFPVVTITHTNAGNVTTAAALEQAGIVARAEERPPSPPASVPPRISPARPATGRKWPDYQRCLQGAPVNRDGTERDRSRADFMWCKWAVERGWSVEETATRLAEVSEKAQERIRLKDEGYPLVTARNAAAAVDRERGSRPAIKSPLHPR